MNQEFIPFVSHSLEEDDIQSVLDVLKSSWIVSGPKVIEFEEKLKEYFGCKYAVALNSCTASLHVLLASLGIGEKDEVITIPFTFIATCDAIIYQKAIPIFVDVREDTFNIDPSKIEAAITKKTKAILLTHYAGQPAQLDEIKEIAQKHNLLLLEDAAHAIGAEYKGKKIGSFGSGVCFSFHAVKNIISGEGGMIATDNQEIADKAKRLRFFGIETDAWKRVCSEDFWFYEVSDLGFKYNMMDIQAAMGVSQLKKVVKFQKIRDQYAQMYNQSFSQIPEIDIPTILPEVKTSWHLYVIKLNLDRLSINRNEFVRKLRELGVGTNVHYLPLHMHKYFKDNSNYRYKDFPVSESLYDRIISLPLYQKMTPQQVERVVDIVIDLIKKYRR
ncbi:MAG: DegT/DnrJ/EryC1/StrS aminotransferase family protein [bacterium]|nr:DegT/DnrJ/EryC1/StrS aminotransferase family protein [bacterium]